MDAKTKIPHLDTLRKILSEQNGLILTSDLAEFNIPRTYLSIMERNMEIERVSRGVYRSPTTLEDEMFSLQSRYKSCIYSHETALFLHDLTDRNPLAFSISVPSGYHSSVLNGSGHKIFYVERLRPMAMRFASPTWNGRSAISCGAGTRSSSSS